MFDRWYALFDCLTEIINSGSHCGLDDDKSKPVDNILWLLVLNLKKGLFGGQYIDEGKVDEPQPLSNTPPRVSNSRKISEATSELTNDSSEAFSMFVVDFSNTNIPKTVSAIGPIFSFYDIARCIMFLAIYLVFQ